MGKKKYYGLLGAAIMIAALCLIVGLAVGLTGDRKPYVAGQDTVLTEAELADVIAREHTDHHGASHVKSKALTNADAVDGMITLMSGSYYLSENVTANMTVTTGEVNLCLNGYTLHGVGTGSVVTVTVGATLNLSDCSADGTGTITGTKVTETTVIGNSRGITVKEDTRSALNQYGGNITGFQNSGQSGGIYVGTGNTYNLYGGKITNNTMKRGGIYIGSATMTMYGGVISENTASDAIVYSGGGIYSYRGTVVMNGGQIINNTAKGNGGGLCYGDGGEFIMNGGELSGNKSALNGSAVYLHNNNNCTFTMNGGKITGHSDGDGVIYGNGPVNLYGGEITGNIGTRYKGTIVVNSTLTVGGDAKVYGNYYGATECNIYPSSGKTIAVSADKPLTEGAKLGVTWPNENTLAQVTSGFGTSGTKGDVKDFFFSDDPLKAFKTYDGEGWLASGHNIAFENASHSGATALDNSSDLNLQTGTYYLSEAITGTITVGSGETVTLCLAGNTLTGDGKSAIKVEEGGVLDLYDDSNANGTVTGGASENGGGIYVAGECTMHDGRVYGNKATNGGGVYVAESGIFTLVEGEIENNTATGKGGGIYNAGSLYIGSSLAEAVPVVQNNSTNNVYLTTGKKVNVNGPLGSTAKVGITAEESGNVAVTAGFRAHGNAAEDLANLISDDSTRTLDSLNGQDAFLYTYEAKTITEEDGSEITYDKVLTWGNSGSLAGGNYILLADFIDGNDAQYVIAVTGGTVNVNLNGFNIDRTNSVNKDERRGFRIAEPATLNIYNATAHTSKICGVSTTNSNSWQQVMLAIGSNAKFNIYNVDLENNSTVGTSSLFHFFYANRAQMSIHNSKISSNRSKDLLRFDAANIIELENVEITDNYLERSDSGIFCYNTSSTLKLYGEIRIHDNQFPYGGFTFSPYLEITVGALAETSVIPWDGVCDGAITNGYFANNPTLDPSKIFTYTPGDYSMFVHNGEVTFGNLYSLTYSAGESGFAGELPAAVEYLRGDKITLPDLIWADHAFVGWLYEGQLYAAGSEFTLPDADVELTPLFRGEAGNVTYTAGDSGYNGVLPSDTAQYSAGDKLTVSSDTLTYEGYSFLGWTYNGKFYAPGETLTVIDGNVELAAAFGKDHDGEKYDKAVKGGALTSGNYVLTGDLKVAGGITVNGGQTVNLCMNGYSIDALGFGDCITVIGGTLNVHDCSEAHTATLKNASSEWGGAVWVRSSGKLTMSDVTVTNSKSTPASSGVGGGMYIEQTSTATLTNVTFKGNTADDRGGALYINYSTVTLNDCTITENSASNYYGGIYLAFSTLNINGKTQIYGNTANGADSDLEINSGTVNVGQLTSGAKIGIKGPATLKGFVTNNAGAQADDYFFMNPNGNEYRFVTDSEDLVIKASYTVNYSAGTTDYVGTLPESARYAEGEEITVSDMNVVGGKGYTFAGWTYNGTIYKPGSSMTMVAENVTFVLTFEVSEITGVTKSEDHSGEYDGKGHELTVGATHELGLTYQWYYKADANAEAKAVNGATKSTYTVTNVSDSGIYYCIIGVVGASATTANSGDIAVNISAVDIADADVKLNTMKYNGKEQTATVKSVTVGGLDASGSVTVGGDSATDVADGEKTVTLTGTGNFTGTTTATWQIQALSLDDRTEVSLGNTKLTYNGSEQTVDVASVKFLGVDAEYDVSNNSATNAGTYTLTITGKGNFTGSIEAKFAIAQLDIGNGISFKIDGGKQRTYDGTEQTVEVTDIKITGYDGYAPTYIVTGDKQTDAGKYFVTVSGTGNFIGSQSMEYTIAPMVVDAEKAEVTFASELTYNGSAQTQTIASIGYNNSRMIIGSEDYTVSGNENTNAGTYTLTITMKGNYSGTIEKEYTIAKRAVTVAIDNASSVYGDSLAELTWKVSDGSIVDGDDLNVRLTKADGTDANDYAITGEYDNANYDVTFAEGTYTIAKRAVTVTIGNASSVYSEKPAELTWKVTDGNVLDGDDLNVKLTKADGTDADEYAITGEYDNANYAVTFVDGKYTVEKATYDTSGLQFADKSVTYSGSEQGIELTGTLPEGFNVVYSGYSTNAGKYTVTAKITSKNYKTTELTATLTIGKASISPSVSMAGFKLGDTPGEPTVTGNPGNGTVTYFYTGTGYSNAALPTIEGEYTITVTIAESENYLGGTASSTFTIEPKPCEGGCNGCNGNVFGGGTIAVIIVAVAILGIALMIRKKRNNK